MPGQACRQPVGGIASSNAGGLAMQMSHGIFVAARLVLLLMLIEFFFEHMRNLRVDEDLQSQQGVAGSGTVWEEAPATFALWLAKAHASMV